MKAKGVGGLGDAEDSPGDTWKGEVSPVLVGWFPLASRTHLAPRPVPGREPRGLGKRQPAQRPGRGPRSAESPAGRPLPARPPRLCTRVPMATPSGQTTPLIRPAARGGAGAWSPRSILGLRAESPGAAGVRSRSGPLSRTGNPGAATTRGFRARKDHTRARKEQGRSKSPVCVPCSKSMLGREARGAGRTEEPDRSRSETSPGSLKMNRG
ncbi:uncharacterized protein LOC144367888 [Ictidomys tridecemlineatus]